MLYLYTLLLTLLYPISLPFLLLLSTRERYRESIPARFWLRGNPRFTRQRHYWFHGCSLGEIRSLGPILEGLRRRGELSDGVNLTAVTNTGRRAAQQLADSFGGEARYLPWELWVPFWGRPPARLVVVEAEFWYLLFHWVRRNRGKVVILNGRISDRSWPKYRRFKWFYRALFREVELILAQREVDRQRFLELGAPRVEVVGNIKSLFTPPPLLPLSFPRPVVVAGSTHRGEEELILPAVDYSRFQLALVPRHPERFREVEQLARRFGEERGVSVGLFSRGELDRDIVVVDRLGVLVSLYAVADRVVLGGSLVPGVGGHNPIEVAYFQKPLISGPEIFNQQALYRLVSPVHWVRDPAQLPELLRQPLPPTTLQQRVDLDQILNLLTQ